MADVFAVIGVYIDNSDDYIETGFFDDSDIHVVGGLSVAANIAKFAEVDVTIASSVAADSNRLRNNSASIGIASGVDTTATRTVGGSVDIAIVSSVSTSSVAADFADVDINITSGLDTTAKRLRNADITIAIVTQTADVTAKRQRGGDITISITPSTVVVADAVDADIAVVDINIVSGVSSSSNRLRNNTSTIVATSTVTGLPKGIVKDAGTDPYAIEDGWAYTWDNVGIYGDWDNWPDTVWGEFTGPHIPITSSTTFQGGLQLQGSVDIASTSGVTASANIVTNNTSNIVSASTVSVSGGRRRDTASTIANTSSLTVDEGLLRDNSITINATSGVTLDGFANPEITISSTSGVTIDGNVVFGSAVINIPSTSSVSATPALKITGQVNITLASAVVIRGSNYLIDPYRTAVVDSETRTIRVLSDDTRTVAIDSETRGIRVLQETRKTPLDSETRQYRLALPPIVNNVRINQ